MAFNEPLLTHYQLFTAELLVIAAVSESVYLAAALIFTTKRRLVSREGPWDKTKHRLVVWTSTVATYIDLETALVISKLVIHRPTTSN